MKRMYQVFISSTYKDLEEERFEVMQTLLKMGCMPAGMELFPAANDSQWNFIKKVIDESDYYLLIVGGKYGSIHPELGISYTRMEYEYATETKKPILRFLIKDQNKLPQEKIEKDPRAAKKLEEFKRILLKDNLCKHYHNPHDLALQVAHGINNLKEQHPESGWISANNKSNDAKEVQVYDFDDVKLQLEKTAYYKIVHLESVSQNPDVIYQKFIPRINKKIDVFSEFITVRVNKFDKVLNHFRSRDRTNGTAIELYSLFPYKGNMDDGDKRATLIEPIIIGPSDIFITNGHTYNGFQSGDLDLGLKVEKNTKIARLIVDFTSISKFAQILSAKPRLFYHRFPNDMESRTSDKIIDEEIFNFQCPTLGYFVAELENMKKDEGLRFEFSVDIDNASNSF